MLEGILVDGISNVFDCVGVLGTIFVFVDFGCIDLALDVFSTFLTSKLFCDLQIINVFIVKYYFNNSWFLNNLLKYKT